MEYFFSQTVWFEVDDYFNLEKKCEYYIRLLRPHIISDLNMSQIDNLFDISGTDL